MKTDFDLPALPRSAAPSVEPPTPNDFHFRDSLPLEDRPDLLDAVGPVFIMGCPRSGTTVLAEVFQTLPRAIVVIGVLSPDRMMHLFGSNLLGAQAENELLWVQRQIFWRAFLKLHDGKLASFRDSLRTLSLRTLLRPHSKPTDSAFIYKEPFLIFAAEAFAAHFQKAKFIHIVRDGRDCADSMARTYPHALKNEVLLSPMLSRLKASEIGILRPWHQWYLPWWLPDGAEELFTGLQPYERYLYLWHLMVTLGRQLAQKLAPERFLEIRYEALCQQPLQTGALIAKFLKIEPNFAYRRFLKSLSVKSIGIYKKAKCAPGPANALAAYDLLAELGYGR